MTPDCQQLKRETHGSRWWCERDSQSEWAAPQWRRGTVCCPESWYSAAGSCCGSSQCPAAGSWRHRRRTRAPSCCRCGPSPSRGNGSSTPAHSSLKTSTQNNAKLSINKTTYFSLIDSHMHTLCLELLYMGVHHIKKLKLKIYTGFSNRGLKDYAVTKV